MNTIEFWPFKVLPPDRRTEHHQQVIDFLEAAFVSGYEPYVSDGLSYGACAPNGRTGQLIHRGADRYWEVILRTQEQVVASFYVDGFLKAADSLLRWLRGDDPAAIEVQCRDSIVSMPGSHGW